MGAMFRKQMSIKHHQNVYREIELTCQFYNLQNKRNINEGDLECQCSLCVGFEDKMLCCETTVIAIVPNWEARPPPSKSMAGYN